METKLCTICKVEKPASEFYKRKASKDGLQPLCIECRREWKKIYYKENKEEILSKLKIYKDDIKEWFDEYKKTLKCEICGESRYWVLHFHHIDRSKKDKGLAYLRKRASKDTILKELAKCQILCANCHMDLHHKEQNAS